MPEETEKTTKSTIWVHLGKAVALLAVGIVSWATTHFSSQFSDLSDIQGTHHARLSQLESDNAKWATMARMEKDIMELRIQVEIMRQVWSYEYGRSVPTGFPSRPGKPDLVPPEELLRDLEAYKMMRQQQAPPNLPVQEEH